MMGQQQQTVADGVFRRTILALLVAAMMVAMMVASAAPAFAKTTFTPRDCQLFLINEDNFSQPAAAQACHPDHL